MKEKHHQYAAIDTKSDLQGLRIARFFLWFSCLCSLCLVPFFMAPFTINSWVQGKEPLMICALQLSGFMLALSAIFLLLFATMTHSFPLQALIAALFVDAVSSVLWIGFVVDGIIEGIIAMDLLSSGSIVVFFVRVLGNVSSILYLMKNHLSFETDQFSPHTYLPIVVFSKIVLWIFSIDCLFIAPVFMFSSSLQLWFQEEELTAATLFAFQLVGLMFANFGGFLMTFAAMLRNSPPRAVKVAFLLDALLCGVWLVSDFYWLNKDMMNSDTIVFSIDVFLIVRIVLDLIAMVKYSSGRKVQRSGIISR